MSLVQLSNSGPACAAQNASVKLDANNAAEGIAKLVLSVVKLLTDVLERQAFRRYNEGTLTACQIDELGSAFM